MRRALAALVLIGCGGGAAFAPVSVTYNDSAPGHVASSTPNVGAAANRLANPKCVSSCEAAPAFPDGGSGAWFPLEGVVADAGVYVGAPIDVAVDSVVVLNVLVYNALNPNGQTLTDESCTFRREVPPGGLAITATREYDAGMNTCRFDVR